MSNEMEAFKYQIKQRITSLGFCMYGATVAVTKKHVDLPLSLPVFRENFLRFFPGISTKNIRMKSARAQVSSENLDEVFGRHWNIVKFTNSSTQVKVFRNIVLLYRQKTPRLR